MDRLGAMPRLQREIPIAAVRDCVDGAACTTTPRVYRDSFLVRTPYHISDRHTAWLLNESEHEHADLIYQQMLSSKLDT